MSQNIRPTPLSSGRHGSTAKVDGSGMAIMSDSSIALKPVIDEPSKPMPPSKASSSSALLMEKLFSCPRMSVNQKRMKRMSRSSTIALTSSAVCGWSAMFSLLVGCAEGARLLAREPVVRPALESAHGRLEGTALVRERVLDPDGPGVADVAFDDALPLELLHALGQKAVRDVRHQLTYLGEAQRAVHQDEQDGAGPALAHQLDGLVVEPATGCATREVMAYLRRARFRWHVKEDSPALPRAG